MADEGATADSLSPMGFWANLVHGTIPPWVMSVNEFVNQLSSAFFENVASAFITDLYCWSRNSGIRHKWVTVRALLANESILWLRVERASKSRWRQMASIVSRFPAEDTVCRRICYNFRVCLSSLPCKVKLGGSIDHLNTNDDAERSQLRSHVKFDDASRPEIRALGHLLESISEHSQYYRLLSVSDAVYS